MLQKKINKMVVCALALTMAVSFETPVQAKTNTQFITRPNIAKRIEAQENQKKQQEIINNSADVIQEAVPNQQGTAGTKLLQYETFTTKGKYLMLQTLMAASPNMTPQRRNVLLRGLDLVGTVTYSQAHHWCSLYGKCRIDGSEKCTHNDCSGFVSDIVGLPKYNTASFWNSFECTPISEGGYQAGDILLHYEGQIADCSGDHCLMYAGKVGKDNVVIDCSSNGVTVRTLNDKYFSECYYIVLPKDTAYTNE